MSRFAAVHGDDSSGSDSSGSDSEDGQVVQAGASLANEFDSSSSDDEKREVRTFAEKQLIELRKITNRLKANLKVTTLTKEDNTTQDTLDFVQVSNSLAELEKALVKAKVKATDEFFQRYLKATVSITQGIAAYADGSLGADIKLSGSSKGALKSLKQKMAKHDKKFKAHLAAYLANPLASEESSDSSDSDSDSDSDAPKKKKTESKQKDADDSDNDSDGDGSEEDWDSDLSDDSDDDIESNDCRTRAYWCKTNKGGAEETKVKRKRVEKKKKEKKVEVREDRKADSVEMSPEQVLKKLQDLLSLRGKRGTNRQTYTADLEMLATKAKDPAAVLKVQVALVTAYLEANLNYATHMDVQLWKKSIAVLQKMLITLLSHPNIRLSEDEDVEEQFDEVDADDELDEVVSGMKAAKRQAKKEEEKEKREADERKNAHVTYVAGNFYSFIYRLHTEYFRSLQGIDHNTSEYVERLRDEPSLSGLCAKAREYYAAIDKISLQSSCALIQLELIYYYTRREDFYEAKKQPSGVVITLAQFLYQHGDGRQKSRALLSHVYWLASHNWFARARDLLLMSHIQDRINEVEVSTRSLFNRCMAQLGLCAFRTGHYKQAHECLADLHSSKHVKELLSQGTRFDKYNNISEAQVKVEKKRQFPFHMHMNLDMLESVHLIGAMLEEVHTLHNHRAKKQHQSLFRRWYDAHHQPTFNAPPESTRDLIMHGAKCLTQGQWRECMQSLSSLRMWTYVTDSARVKASLETTVKQTAVRMYLMMYGSSYVSISLDSLEARFELPRATLIRISSKMMVTGELDGVWDQPSQSLVMRNSQPTRLQTAALKYAERAMSFMEENDKLVNKQHSFSDKSSYESKGGDKRWGRDNRRNNNYNNRQIRN